MFYLNATGHTTTVREHPQQHPCHAEQNCSLPTPKPNVHCRTVRLKAETTHPPNGTLPKHGHTLPDGTKPPLTFTGRDYVLLDRRLPLQNVTILYQNRTRLDGTKPHLYHALYHLAAQDRTLLYHRITGHSRTAPERN